MTAITQHTTHNTQHTTHNTQHTTHKAHTTQSTHNTHNTFLNMALEALWRCFAASVICVLVSMSSELLDRLVIEEPLKTDRQRERGKGGCEGGGSQTNTQTHTHTNKQKNKHVEWVSCFIVFSSFFSFPFFIVSSDLTIGRTLRFFWASSKLVATLSASSSSAPSPCSAARAPS